MKLAYPPWPIAANINRSALPLSYSGRYNQRMPEEHRHMPDANRLSVLVATILLAYALAHLLDTQPYALNLNIFSVNLSIPLSLNMVAMVMAAGLTAAGMDWLLRGHPHLHGENTFQHWILPALTAFVLGVPLYYLPFGLVWWASFGFGGLLLLLSFLAEYIALDPSDVRHPAASAGLAALSYAMFLILMTTLSFSSARLIVVALIAFPAAALVVLRALHLRTGKWEFAWSFGIALIMLQLAAALHYWPLEPVQVGLALLGPLYALTELAINLDEAISIRQAALEAFIGVAVFWAAALLVRG